jgi:hypothetical protein
MRSQDQDGRYFKNDNQHAKCGQPTPAQASQYFAMVRTAFSSDLTATQRALNLDLHL